MLRSLAFLSAAAALLFGGLPRASAQEDEVLSAKNFAHVVRVVKPGEGEAPWNKIPWLLDLNEARKKAAAQGKPLFVWSMSGEPLGTC